jgi:hypothetical protein
MLRPWGRAVAEAVALAGVREGLAPEGVGEEAVASLLERARWRPQYQGLDASLDALTS